MRQLWRGQCGVKNVWLKIPATARYICLNIVTQHEMQVKDVVSEPVIVFVRDKITKVVLNGENGHPNKLTITVGANPYY